VPWHSFTEQCVMPWLLSGAPQPGPYTIFQCADFLSGKFITTIHDVTILHFDTGKQAHYRGL
jgi:hypothetical protein